MAPAVGRVHRALLPAPTPEPVLEYADNKDQFATTNSTLWRQQRYAPRDNHYLWDRARHRTAGDVACRCCRARRPAAPSEAARSRVQPVVVRAPAGSSRRRRARCRRRRRQCGLSPATRRPEQHSGAAVGEHQHPTRRSKRTRQHHKHAHTGAALVGDALLPHPHPNGTHPSNRTVDLGSGSDLLLLDAALRVVVRAPIHGGACAQSPDALVDVRLFDAAGALYASYNTYGRAAWTRFIPGARVVPRQGLPRPGCRASAQRRDGAHSCGGRSVTPRRPALGGSGLAARRGRRCAQRRPRGLRRHAPRSGDEPAKPNPSSAAAAPGLELVHFAPWTEWHVRGGGVVRRAAPTSFPEDLHNSIHPLWIPEMGAYLGVAHRHSLPHEGGPPARAYERDGKPHPPFQFGYAYRHVFLLLSPQLRVTRYSREYCLPALDGGVGGPACEGVQFVVAAFRGARRRDAQDPTPTGNRVSRHDAAAGGAGPTATPPAPSFSYSVMDCESAALTISLARLDELLEFMNEQPDYSSNIDPPGVCVRPQGWCVHSTAVYDVAKDCDGDGIPDPYCSDDLGRKGILSSKNACADTWPKGVCPPPPPPL